MSALCARAAATSRSSTRRAGQPFAVRCSLVSFTTSVSYCAMTSAVGFVTGRGQRSAAAIAGVAASMGSATRAAVTTARRTERFTVAPPAIGDALPIGAEAPPREPVNRLATPAEPRDYLRVDGGLGGAAVLRLPGLDGGDRGFLAAGFPRV